MGRRRTVHQLMAESFLNHKPNGRQEYVINHKNLNKLDNRLENLEIVSHRENSNQKHIKSSSKYTGVSWYKSNKRWIAAISVSGKKIYLGSFNNEYAAHVAYQNKLKEID